MNEGLNNTRYDKTMEPQHNEQKKLPDETNTQQILKTNKRKLWTPVQLRGAGGRGGSL